MNSTMHRSLDMRLRSQALTADEYDHAVWRVQETSETWPAARTALLLCDVWDDHWCRGAVERLDEMVPRMAAVTNALRERGVLIVHAPSETVAYYQRSPARQRIREAPRVELALLSDHDEPPLPIDDSDGGADTGEKPWRRAWTRQHAGIDIDESLDVISDDGDEICSYLQAKGIDRLLFMGVHTNMCVLNRSFGIKRTVRQGLNVALVRDLTDTMYNPARSPYVSHTTGTELVVGYIEKFWCPTVLSEDLVPLAGA